MSKPDVQEPVLVINRGDYQALCDQVQSRGSRIAEKATTPIGDRAQQRHEERLKEILGEDTFKEAAGVTPKTEIDPEADEPRLEWRDPSDTPF